MNGKLTIVALSLSLMTPVAAPAQTRAQVSHERQYHGHNRRYYRHCKRSSGRTGLLAGAGGGGLAAAALGAGPIGIAAGVVGGGLLGRHLDKRHDAAQNRRNHC
ncbi:hypothetical protein [Sphingomonas bacterium]|uniref:hypothetical protein n=1 Tax=Sphingomonas bacterium TaxID=1895847 RepID=UPI001575CAE7|nr:hypothetical protein [Sphingomonas bacterium]